MAELASLDLGNALSRSRLLAPGTRVLVIRVERLRGCLWYGVQAIDTQGLEFARGWINSMALIGQTPVDRRTQLNRQSKAATERLKQLKADIAEYYDVNEDVLGKIGVEGLEQNWPMP